jgi:TetR/AcrR family transcriptional regulator, transcriptional repressor for nem operon
VAPGPAKAFDPEEALERARDMFWRLGYDGTGIRELEEELGIGRKSLYDTFGGKRELYLKSLRQYADTILARICDRLEDERCQAIANLERVLLGLQAHHGSGESLGCLLGVAVAQIDRKDAELMEILGGHLQRIEDAFERTIRRAQAEGSIRADQGSRDLARNLVALTQGMALLGRIQASSTKTRSVVRAALLALRPGSGPANTPKPRRP